MNNNNSKLIILDNMSEVNLLPDLVNWNEVNDFLFKNNFGKIIGDHFWFKPGWENSQIITESGLSQTSIDAMKCLDKDTSFYYDIICGKVPGINLNGENITLLDLLNYKYSGLCEELRKNIYNSFMYNCR